jgi:hypothetical protein
VSLTRMQKSLLAALVATISCSVGSTGPVNGAPFQATWTTRSAGVCNANTSNGVINFNRNELSGNPASRAYCNKTVNRDSSLRSAGFDTFADNFFVGTTSAQAPNTWTVVNWVGFPVVAYSSSCYSGTTVTMSNGGGVVPGGSGSVGIPGLMSHKAPASAGC